MASHAHPGILSKEAVLLAVQSGVTVRGDKPACATATLASIKHALVACEHASVYTE